MPRRPHPDKKEMTLGDFIRAAGVDQVEKDDDAATWFTCRSGDYDRESESDMWEDARDTGEEEAVQGAEEADGDERRVYQRQTAASGSNGARWREPERTWGRGEAAPSHAISGRGWAGHEAPAP